MNDKTDAPAMLECCQLGHDIVEGPQDFDSPRQFLFWCVNCDKDYLQVAVAFNFGPPEWKDDADYSG